MLALGRKLTRISVEDIYRQAVFFFNMLPAYCVSWLVLPPELSGSLPPINPTPRPYLGISCHGSRGRLAFVEGIPRWGFLRHAG